MDYTDHVCFRDSGSHCKMNQKVFLLNNSLE